jgi:hypothetical protein
LDVWGRALRVCDPLVENEMWLSVATVDVAAELNCGELACMYYKYEVVDPMEFVVFRSLEH